MWSQVSEGIDFSDCSEHAIFITVVVFVLVVVVVVILVCGVR